ncbi:carbon storage regulator [Microbulbifer variabilis]
MLTIKFLTGEKLRVETAVSIAVLKVKDNQVKVGIYSPTPSLSSA